MGVAPVGIHLEHIFVTGFVNTHIACDDWGYEPVIEMS